MTARAASRRPAHDGGNASTPDASHPVDLPAKPGTRTTAKHPETAEHPETATGRPGDPGRPVGLVRTTQRL